MKMFFDVCLLIFSSFLLSWGFVELLNGNAWSLFDIPIGVMGIIFSYYFLFESDKDEY